MMNPSAAVTLSWPKARKALLCLMLPLAALSFQANAQNANLQFWDMVWGPPEYIDAAEALVEQFNEEYPGITVEYRSIPWSNWYETFVSAIGAGTAPDISTGAGYQAVQLYDMGAILPIDDVIAELRENGELEDFLPGTIDTLQYDGHYVAFPWGIDIRVWYYRKDQFEQAGLAAPTNWEEFRKAAEELTDGNRYGMVASGDTGGTHYLYTFILNNGGGLFTEDREVNLTSERNMEALGFLSELAQDGLVHPASPGYTSDDRRRAFLQGDGSIMLDGPGLLDQYPEEAANIGIMEPLLSPRGETGTIFWVNNIMLYRQTEHPEETKTFLKWWSKNQLPLWTEGRTGQLPVRESFTQNPYFQGEEHRSYIIENYVPIGQTTATHAAGIFPELNEVEGEGVMQTLMQDLMQGKNLTESVGRAANRMKTIVR
jgi:multiple sugar transport system substrate-binding protein